MGTRVCVCMCKCKSEYVCKGTCLSEVPFLVQRQMVGPGETSLAMATLERFGASVLAVVAGQLVRSGKAPAAADPFAFVRLFACNAKINTHKCINIKEQKKKRAALVAVFIA